MKQPFFVFFRVFWMIVQIKESFLQVTEGVKVDLCDGNIESLRFKVQGSKFRIKTLNIEHRILSLEYHSIFP